MPIHDHLPEPDALFPGPIDPHGHAALLLVESLLHGLMERSVLSLGDAIEIVETAVDVQADIAEHADGASRKMWQSHLLLTRIATSLRHDLHGPKGDGLALS